MDNPYYGKHHFQSKYEEGFEYKSIQQYDTLEEWLDNIFIKENENIAFVTQSHNIIYLLDKRIGFPFTNMSSLLTHQQIRKLKDQPEKAQSYLVRYYHQYKK